MPKSITMIPQLPQLEKPKRVAAYARVSCEKDAMLHSLAEQVSYFSELIQATPGWVYAGVYSDEAKTGTNTDRDGFQELMEDCRAGKIDIVVTKSLTRFARNTVALLESVRELRSLGIDVFFEKENVHGIDGGGELLLSILASYAQEESRSVSENQKWRIRRNFEEGVPWNGALLGYRLHNGRYEIIEEEASLVRHIYGEYLSGKGYAAIAKGLNKDGIPSRFGVQWAQSVVSKILSNYTYTGNLILQKTYRENHLTKRTLINDGQFPKYHVEGSHTAIIDMETFNAVQEEKANRAARFNKKPQSKKTYPFSGMMTCAVCGKNYRRKVIRTGVVWVCSTFNVKGKAACASKQVPEETLKAATADVLETPTFNEKALKSQISKITVHNGNRLVFTFIDGKECVCTWRDRSRRESWTPEMKARAAERTKGQRRKTICQE